MKPSMTVMLQARLGSTRLPGKVLLDFNGVPMIEHIYSQVKKIKSVDLNFVLSTSPDAKDDRLAEWAASKNIQVVRHNVDDIVGRLYHSLQKNNDAGLIRVWGDCVFICPDIIEKMLQKFNDENLDFITNAGDKRNLPVGLDAEIYRRPLLEKMNTVGDVFLREFPLQYVIREPGVKYAYFINQQPMDVIHLTVDYPEDFEAAKAISREIKDQFGEINFPSLFEYYSTNRSKFDSFSKAARFADFKAQLKEWTETKEKK
ncbi:MAG: hypothetical protein K0R29_754 [Pseudobdellovibrio sp.]|jgi:spore coat polysaccharide biosynthesis protein SpsF|nr:hypothetical protein [Pseudobdellovibrio sp.]